MMLVSEPITISMLELLGDWRTSLRRLLTTANPLV